MRGLRYDRPHVVVAAPAVLGGPGVAARCRVEAGDFFERVPASGAIYLLSQVLHDWDDEGAALILRRCRAAMASGARLAVAPDIDLVKVLVQRVETLEAHSVAIDLFECPSADAARFALLRALADVQSPLLARETSTGVGGDRFRHAGEDHAGVCLGQRRGNRAEHRANRDRSDGRGEGNRGEAPAARERKASGWCRGSNSMLVRAHYKETGVGVVLSLNATVVGHWLIPQA